MYNLAVTKHLERAEPIVTRCAWPEARCMGVEKYRGLTRKSDAGEMAWWDQVFAERKTDAG